MVLSCIYVGNNSSLYYSGYTSSIFGIDSKFNNRYTSKLLFLDYEIGSKLNFLMILKFIDYEFGDF